LQAVRFHSFHLTAHGLDLNLFLKSCKELRCLDFFSCILGETFFTDLLQRGSTILPSLERISLWSTIWSLEDLTTYLTLRRTALDQTVSSPV
ncbi:hypothetical protein M422DRAFT_38437, partial [Sphaerobolus stellatus SS14]